MWRTDSFEKTLMLGKIEGGRRRGWQRMRWLDGITDSMDEFEQALGVADGQGGLACCTPWGRKESDTTEWLNWISQLASVQHCPFSLYPIPSACNSGSISCVCGESRRLRSHWFYSGTRAWCVWVAPSTHTAQAGGRQGRWLLLLLQGAPCATFSVQQTEGQRAGACTLHI